MSMIGYYLRADEDMTQKIVAGEGNELLFGQDNDERFLCIDKAWHAIHYIVTGSVWEVPEDDPVGQLVLGGIPINEEDMGYGPARLISAETVSRLSEALGKWDEALFREHFHMQDMAENEIYPIVDDEDEALFFEYIWDNFKELQKFFKAAAQDGQNVITFLG